MEPGTIQRAGSTLAQVMRVAPPQVEHHPSAKWEARLRGGPSAPGTSALAPRISPYPAKGAPQFLHGAALVAAPMSDDDALRRPGDHALHRGTHRRAMSAKAQLHVER